MIHQSLSIIKTERRHLHLPLKNEKGAVTLTLQNFCIRTYLWKCSVIDRRDDNSKWVSGKFEIKNVSVKIDPLRQPQKNQYGEETCRCSVT